MSFLLFIGQKGLDRLSNEIAFGAAHREREGADLFIGFGTEAHLAQLRFFEWLSQCDLTSHNRRNQDKKKAHLSDLRGLFFVVPRIDAQLTFGHHLDFVGPQLWYQVRPLRDRALADAHCLGRRPVRVP